MGNRTIILDYDSYKSIEKLIEDNKKNYKNNKKIAFIYCVNNERLLKKSIKYLGRLDIPEDFTLEQIEVYNAKSITRAYNDAMQCSSAKYKIYLHQDVYILNKDFIKDILQIFNKDRQIGMIGIIGAKELTRSGIWWQSKNKYGKVYDSNTGIMKALKFNDVKKDYESVEAIDGLLMVAQYDIPWRWDIIKGWHFYDLSQCQEFIKRGFKVVIPKQKKIWCKHDCGIIKPSESYERLREVFINEYYKN